MQREQLNLQKDSMQEIGFLQRRGKSWCAQPIDKSLRMPGTCIKKVARYSAAPEIDAMQMDLGDQIRTADGWLWVVRSCGGAKRWVRTDFESSIKKRDKASSASLASFVRALSVEA